MKIIAADPYWVNGYFFLIANSKSSIEKEKWIDALSDAYQIISNLPLDQKEIYNSDSLERAELCNTLSDNIKNTITQKYSNIVEKPEDLISIIDDALAGLE